MIKGVFWLAALCLGCIVVASPRIARAGEFCPARIAQVTNVDGAASTYGVRIAAFSQRSVTGQLVFETDAGWYRAPFRPVLLQKDTREFQSASIYVQLPKTTLLRNVWLAQAASDDPLWRRRGVVACAPDPERHTARGVTSKPPPSSQTVSALPMPAPFSYACNAPFAQAVAQQNTIDADDLAPGQYAAVQVDLDANGDVVGAIGIDASGGDFTLKKTLETRVHHMRFSPAIAYCKPVPSTYVLTELSAP